MSTQNCGRKGGSELLYKIRTMTHILLKNSKHNIKLFYSICHKKWSQKSEFCEAIHLQLSELGKELDVRNC